MLSEYRQLPPQDWTPYQSDVSAEIEATYQSGDASCHILVGAVSLEICLKTGDLPTREMGIQKHGPRVHFVKRMFITSTDYDQQMRMFLDGFKVCSVTLQPPHARTVSASPCRGERVDLSGL